MDQADRLKSSQFQNQGLRQRNGPSPKNGIGAWEIEQKSCAYLDRAEGDKGKNPYPAQGIYVSVNVMRTVEGEVIKGQFGGPGDIFRGRQDVQDIVAAAKEEGEIQAKGKACYKKSGGHEMGQSGVSHDVCLKRLSMSMKQQRRGDVEAGEDKDNN